MKKDNNTSLIKRLRSYESKMFSDTAVEIWSNSTMYISGCKKILDYNSRTIKLKCRGMTVTIEGEKLLIEVLVNSQISVKGVIKEVKYTDD